jgi:alkylhydroperoxidase family enzyme
VSAHADNLQLQGLDSSDVDHIALATPDSASLSEKERALLEFVRVLTLEPAKTRDSHVDKMRRLGWTDPQIFEAAFVTSLFAFLNRMADAYGLDYRMNRWIPPDMRSDTKVGDKPKAALGPGDAAKPLK